MNEEENGPLFRLLEILGSNRWTNAKVYDGSEKKFILHSPKNTDHKSYIGEEGIIIDWMNKYERIKEGISPAFRNGEKVLISGFYEHSLDGKCIIPDFDRRMTDLFFVDDKRLEKHKNLPINVILNVEGEGEMWDLNNCIHHYKASLVEIVSTPPVNPLNLTGMNPNDRVIIEGKFLGFDNSGHEDLLDELRLPKESLIDLIFYSNEESNFVITSPDGMNSKIYKMHLPSDKAFDSSYARIRTEDGRIISIKMMNGRTRFTDGSIENIIRKMPIMNDSVRMAAYVNESGKLALGKRDPFHLVQPSVKRLDEFSKLRDDVRKDLDMISSYSLDNDYTSLRKAIGEIKRKDLTSEELRTVRNIVESIPEHEKPVQLCVSKYNPNGKRNEDIAEIDGVFETTIEAMTKKEFVSFARGLFRNNDLSEGYGYIKNLYNVAKDLGIDYTTIESIATYCLDTRIPKIMGEEDVFDLDTHYSFMCLAALGTESSSEKLFEYMVQSVDHLKQNGSMGEKNFLLFATLSTIESEKEGLHRETLMRKLPYMIELSETLSGHPNHEGPSECLNETIKYVQMEIMRN